MRISAYTRRVLAALALILLAGMALRLYRIEAQSLWFDEAWSAYAAAQPTLIAAANADATNPPLYYALLHVAARGFGDSEFALRFFSTLTGILGVALACRLGRQLFGSRAGVYAALLAACSPLLWWAAQEARMYTLLADLVLVVALAWHTLLRKNGVWARLALCGAELALLYAHNTGPVVALWLNVVTLIVWAVRRSLRHPDWRYWLAGQIIVGLLWLPYFVARYLSLTDANSAVVSGQSFDLRLLVSIWEALWAGNWALVGRVPLLGLLAGVALILSLLLIPWRWAAARWLVLHVLLLTAGLIIGLAVLGNELHGRYLVMAAPLLLVALGAGLARLRSAWLRWGGAVLFVVIFAAAFAYAQDPLYGHDDARAMVRYYADTLGPDDTVLAWSYADRYDLAYYWERLGVAARRVTLPEGADLDAILPLLPRDGDVALNVWYTQRADFRGMMNCLLAHGTTTLPETFTTYGMTNLLFRRPTLDVPDLHALDTSSDAARIDAVGDIPTMTADRALCLPINITLTAPTAGDLKAALIVHNAPGWEIARADVPFAQADQRLSSQLAPGDSLTAYPLLRLPVGTPPGDYPLFLRLYDDTHPSGYNIDLTDGRSALELPLGVWTAPPGADWRATGRETDLRQTIMMAVSSDLLLLAHNLPDETRVTNGERLRMALLWEGEGPLPALIVADIDGRWEVTVAAPDGPRDEMALDWRELPIPADADSGAAVIRIEGGEVLARVAIEAIPALMTPPEIEYPLGAHLPGLGTLAGYTLPAETVARDALLPLTLVWQADGAPDTSYTIFAQLLDADGVLIAQSDALPAAGQRPTTGWRQGEYILDEHQLRFNEAAHPGPAALIVGLYDAASGERVRWEDGADALRLDAQIVVE